MKKILIAGFCFVAAAMPGAVHSQTIAVSVDNTSLVEAAMRAKAYGEAPQGAPPPMSSIALLTLSGTSIVSREIAEDERLTTIFDATGSKLIAVTYQWLKGKTRVDVIDAKSGNLLNSFPLKDFELELQPQDIAGAQPPRTLCRLGDGTFAAIGVRDQKVTLVNFSSLKEISRMSLPQVGMFPGFISRISEDDRMVLTWYPWTTSYKTLQYGMLHFGPAVEFRDLNFGKSFETCTFALLPDGMAALDTEGGCTLFDKSGKQRAQFHIEQKLPGEFSPDVFGFTSDGKLVVALNYLSELGNANGKTQVAIIDTHNGNTTLGPEIATMKYGTVGHFGKEGDCICALPPDNSRLAIYSLPASRLVRNIPLAYPWLYHVTVK